MKMRVALIGMTMLALAGCGEPWMGNGSALVRAPASHTSPLVSTLPGLLDKQYTEATLDDGRVVIYERTASCTTPNTGYAMHHMAGKFECAVLYTSEAHDGSADVIFRDWLGRAYTPDQYGVWKRLPEYDQVRVEEEDDPRYRHR